MAVKLGWRLLCVAAVFGPAAIVVVAARSRVDQPGWWGDVAAQWGIDTGLQLNGWLLAGIAVAAALVVATNPVWRKVRLAETLVHEMGHAFVGGALGGSPARITVGRDRSGLARWGSTSRTATAVATYCGYPWPAVLGVGAVLSAALGAAQAWTVWAVVVLAATLVVMARNVLAWAVAAGSVVVLAGVLWWAPSALTWMVATVGVLLIDAAFRSAVDLVRLPSLEGSDAAELRRLLVVVPARVAAVAELAGVVVVVAVAAAVYGALL